MACKPLNYALVFLIVTFFSIATCFPDQQNGSIAEPPDCTARSSISMTNLASFLPRAWKGLHQSQRMEGRRSLTEIVSVSSNGQNAQAPGPIAYLSEEDDDEEERPAVRWVIGVSAGIGSGILAATIALSMYQVSYDYIKRPKPNRPVVFQRKIIDSTALEFLNKENPIEALECLGKGASAEVFKASLENGHIIAIKKILYSSHEGDAVLEGRAMETDLTYNAAQVHAELMTLGRVRHRNLVTLLAYIPKPNFHILVYDFMENGSLHDVLGKVEEGSMELAWPRRLQIAIDVAEGLKYLHFDCTPQIVHRDLKPSNILLNTEMDAHIGDFGIAKVMPLGDSKTHFSSNNLAGTVGFMAPEYHQTLRYSTRGDVYSFGILLVVLLTGKEPSHDFFSDLFTHMGSWVTGLFASGEERVLGVLDPHLSGQGLEAQMLLAFKIAAFCLNETPDARPTSQDVLHMLNQIKSCTDIPPEAGVQRDVI